MKLSILKTLPRCLRGGYHNCKDADIFPWRTLPEYHPIYTPKLHSIFPDIPSSSTPAFLSHPSSSQQLLSPLVLWSDQAFKIMTQNQSLHRFLLKITQLGLKNILLIHDSHVPRIIHTQYQTLFTPPINIKSTLITPPGPEWKSDGKRHEKTMSKWKDCIDLGHNKHRKDYGHGRQQAERHNGEQFNQVYNTRVLY